MGEKEDLPPEKELFPVDNLDEWEFKCLRLPPMSRLGKLEIFGRLLLLLLQSKSLHCAAPGQTSPLPSVKHQAGTDQSGQRGVHYKAT